MDIELCLDSFIDGDKIGENFLKLTTNDKYVRYHVVIMGIKEDENYDVLAEEVLDI